MRAASLSQAAPASIPNNFGSTLLLASGLLLLPLVVGVPLLLLGLARLRDAKGNLALPLLALRLNAALGLCTRLPRS